MRVVVFRARDDGERTAVALKQRGHEAVLAPVLTIVPTGEQPGAGDYDGVVFTSAHGVEALDATSSRRLAPLPCFCVGPRTADLAMRSDFSDVRTARADAEALSAQICAFYAGAAHLLLVSGRDRKPTVEARLAAVGHRATIAVVYEARETPGWTPDVVTAMANGTIDAALHYSRRSAELALARAVAAGVGPALLACAHHCLSEDAAAPLRTAGAKFIVLAAAMNEDSLLDSLD